MLCRCHWHCTSTQLNSSLLTKGSRMAKRNTVHKNKSNDQSEWDKNTIKQTITWLSKTWKVIATVACMWTTVKFGRDVTVMAGGGALWWRVAGDRSGTDIRSLATCVSPAMRPTTGTRGWSHTTTCTQKTFLFLSCRPISSPTAAAILWGPGVLNPTFWQWGSKCARNPTS